MSIQRQEAGKLVLCAQILVWVSVSVEKAPNTLKFGPFSNRAKLWYVGGFFSIYAHPNLNLSTQRQHSNLLPLASGLTPHMPIFGRDEISTF